MSKEKSAIDNRIEDLHDSIRSYTSSIVAITKQIILLEKLRPEFESLAADPMLAKLDFSIYSSISFNYLKHEQIVALMKVFPAGEWEKEKMTDYSGNEYFSYQGEYKGYNFLLEGEPPSSCKIETVEVVVPAVPAKVKKVKKIICPAAPLARPCNLLVEPIEGAQHSALLEGEH